MQKNAGPSHRPTVLDGPIRALSQDALTRPNASLPTHAAIVRTMNVRAMPKCPFGIMPPTLLFPSPIPYYIYDYLVNPNVLLDHY